MNVGTGKGELLFWYEAIRFDMARQEEQSVLGFQDSLYIQLQLVRSNLGRNSK